MDRKLAKFSQEDKALRKKLVGSGGCVSIFVISLVATIQREKQNKKQKKKKKRKTKEKEKEKQKKNQSQ